MFTFFFLAVGTIMRISYIFINNPQACGIAKRESQNQLGYPTDGRKKIFSKYTNKKG